MSQAPSARGSATGRRLFAALQVPDPVRAHLADAVALVRAELSTPRAGGAGSIRWSDPATWHLTLAFYGTAATEVEARLSGLLATAAGAQSRFRLRVAGGGRFGSRVLWAGVAARPDLAPLAHAAAAAARAAGPVAPSSGVEHRYRPHLTLARGHPGADFRGAVDALRDYRGPEWLARELVLVHSVLGAGPGGAARHEVVGAWPLRAPLH